MDRNLPITTHRCHHLTLLSKASLSPEKNIFSQFWDILYDNCGSEQNCWLSFDLQSLHVTEKCSNIFFDARKLMHRIHVWWNTIFVYSNLLEVSNYSILLVFELFGHIFSDILCHSELRIRWKIVVNALSGIKILCSVPGRQTQHVNSFPYFRNHMQGFWMARYPKKILSKIWPSNNLIRPFLTTLRENVDVCT